MIWFVLARLRLLEMLISNQRDYESKVIGGWKGGGGGREREIRGTKKRDRKILEKYKTGDGTLIRFVEFSRPLKFVDSQKPVASFLDERRRKKWLKWMLVHVNRNKNLNFVPSTSQVTKLKIYLRKKLSWGFGNEKIGSPWREEWGRRREEQV